ncbi:MAG: 1-(5-phosphoribosyl)-5-[(5-phosphoribosylamino)methylideneamino]imidazole-4-carboxamide isomerase [Armatimonadetes bacterium]|nr:1-(5-phosphoribosyl)-5-[(5-phosphoribosylamino)methylideneamino]imidazole-4-carboxamide isomerase [Armatimonadota bacterium]
MEIIPAIDIMDGKCVRLLQGRFDQVTVFSDDPVDMAKRWADQGARRLHIVDLKGSKSGSPQEIDLVSKIAAAVNVPIQLGGGIRTIETAQTMLKIGVDRVIIGTSAVLDPIIAETIFEALGERAVLGVDARDGRVAIKGWEETTAEDAIDFALRMQHLGARRIIYTDISRDGMLLGTNISAIRRMAEAVNIPVIASGGVSSVEDIRALKELEPMGIEGAILGKVLYTGDLTLAEAIAAAL